MVHIQFRRGAAIPANEHHKVGEPLWDDINSRFGVFNNRTPTAVEWYPIVIGDKLIMNANQTLGGKTSGGVENNVYLEFTAQNELAIRNRNSGMMYAKFASTGATFNALAAEGTAYTGIINGIINGNLSVRKAVQPITTVDNSNPNFRTHVIAPNWYMWKTAGTGGRMVLYYPTVGQVGLPFVGCPNVLIINASSAPNSSGLRTFHHGYRSLAGQEVTFSSWLWGVNGSVAYQRAVSEAGTTLFSKQVTMSGSWQRIDTTFTVPVHANARWIGFDVLYNPSGNTNTQQTWIVGPVQLEYGDTASRYENRPEAIERALCDAIYREGKVRLVNGSDWATVPLHNFDYGLRVDALESSSKAVTVANADKHGFSLQVPSLTAASYVQFAASMIPTTAETA